MPAIDEDENTIEVINISSETMKFEIDGMKIKLAPKERFKIHKNYATPRVMQPERDPVPSTIELLTNKKVLPINDKRVRAVLGAAGVK